MSETEREGGSERARESARERESEKERAREEASERDSVLITNTACAMYAPGPQQSMSRAREMARCWKGARGEVRGPPGRLAVPRLGAPGTKLGTVSVWSPAVCRAVEW